MRAGSSRRLNIRGFAIPASKDVASLPACRQQIGQMPGQNDRSPTTIKAQRGGRALFQTPKRSNDYQGYRHLHAGSFWGSRDADPAGGCHHRGGDLCCRRCITAVGTGSPANGECDGRECLADRPSHPAASTRCQATMSGQGISACLMKAKVATWSSSAHHGKP